MHLFQIEDVFSGANAGKFSKYLMALLFVGTANLVYAQKSAADWLVPQTIVSVDTFRLKAEFELRQIQAIYEIAQHGSIGGDTVGSGTAALLSQFFKGVARVAGKATLAEVSDSSWKAAVHQLFQQPQEERLMAMQIYDSIQYVPIPSLDAGSKDFNRKHDQIIFTALTLIGRSFIRVNGDSTDHKTFQESKTTLWKEFEKLSKEVLRAHLPERLKKMDRNQVDTEVGNLLSCLDSLLTGSGYTIREKQLVRFAALYSNYKTEKLAAILEDTNVPPYLKAREHTLQLLRNRWSATRKQVSSQSDSIRKHLRRGENYGSGVDSSHVKSYLVETSAVDRSELFEWFLVDLKEEFFVHRTLLRELELIQDTGDKATVIDQQVIDSATEKLLNRLKRIRETNPGINHAYELATVLLDSPERRIQQIKNRLHEKACQRFLEQLRAALRINPLDSIHFHDLDRISAFASQTTKALSSLTAALEPLDLTGPALDSIKYVIVPVTLQREANELLLKFEVQQWAKSDNAAVAFNSQSRTGFSFPPIRINWLNQTAEQVKETILAALKSSSATLAEGVDAALFQRMGHYWGLPVAVLRQDAAFHMKKGFQFRLFDGCVRLHWREDQVADSCRRIVLQPDAVQLRKQVASLMESLIRQQLQAYQQELYAALQPVIEPLAIRVTPTLVGQYTSSVNFSYYGLNQKIIVTLPLDRFDAQLGGATVRLVFSADGLTEAKVILNKEALWNLYLPVYKWVLAEKIKVDSLGGYQLGSIVLLSGPEAIRLGQATLTAKGFYFHPADSSQFSIPLGSGFALHTANVSFDGTKKQFYFRGVSLSVPTQLDALAQMNPINLYYTETGGQAQWELDSISSQKAGAVLENILLAQGLLPPGVRVSKVFLGSGGIYPKFTVDKQQWQDKTSDLEQQLTSLLEPMREQLLSFTADQLEQVGRFKELWNKQTSSQQHIANLFLQCLRTGFAKAELEQFLAACQRHTDSQVEVSPFLTLRYQSTPNYFEFGMLSSWMDCNNQPWAVFRVAAGQPVTLVKLQKECLSKWVSQHVGLPVEKIDVTWDIAHQQAVVTLEGRWQEDAFPLSLAVGLDGSVRWDHDAIKKAAFARAKKTLQQQFSTGNLERAKKEIEDQLEMLSGNLGAVLKVERWEPANGWPQLVVLNLKFTSLGNLLVRDVVFRIGSAGLDFSRSTIENIAPLENVLTALANDYVKISNIAYQSGTITARAKLNFAVPDFSEEIEASLSYSIDGGKVTLNGLRDNLFNMLAGKLFPWEHSTEELRLRVTKVSWQNPELVFTGNLSLYEKEMPLLPFKIYIPLGGGKWRFVTDFSPQEFLKDFGNKLASSILNCFDLGGSLPGIDPAFEFTNVRLAMDGAFAIPHGLLFQAKIKLLNLGEAGSLIITTPDILLSHKGIRPANIRSLQVTIPGTFPVPPFKLTEVTGLLNNNTIELNAKLSLEPPESEKLLHLKGRFLFDLKKPAQLTSRSELVALSILNLGYHEKTINIPDAYWEEKVDFGGPLSSVVSLKGDFGIYGKRKQMTGKAKLTLFKGLELLEANTLIDIGELKINSTAKFDLKIAKATGSFSTQSRLANPALFGKLNVIKISKFEIADAQVNIKPHIAELNFSVVGIRLGLAVPSYNDLSTDLLMKLVQRLLSPDLKGLPKALEQILSGNFTINPFADFGPAGGGVSSAEGRNDGDGGPFHDGLGNQADAGEGGQTQNRAGSYGSLGQLAENLAAAAESQPPLGPVTDGAGKDRIEIKDESGVALPGSGTFIEPQFNPEGKYSFPIEGDTSDLQVFQLEVGKDKVPLCRVKVQLDGHAQFVQDGAYWRSMGLLLLTGENFLVHALRQRAEGDACGSNAATLYWFKGREADRMGQGRFLLSRLRQSHAKDAPGWCLDRLAQLSNGEKIAFSRFLVGVATKIAGMQGLDLELIEDAFWLASGTEQQAVVVRYKSYSSYFVYSSDEKAPDEITLDNLDAAGLLLEDNTFVLALLQEISNRSSAGLQRVGQDIYIQLDCAQAQKDQLLKAWRGNLFELKSRVSCPSDCCPQPLVAVDEIIPPNPNSSGEPVLYQIIDDSLAASTPHDFIAWLIKKDGNITLFEKQANGWRRKGNGGLLTSGRSGLSLVYADQGQKIVYWFANTGRLKPQPTWGKFSLSKLGVDVDEVWTTRNTLPRRVFEEFISSSMAMSLAGTEIRDDAKVVVIKPETAGFYAVCIQYPGYSEYTCFAARGNEAEGIKTITEKVRPAADKPLEYSLTTAIINAFAQQ